MKGFRVGSFGMISMGKLYTVAWVLKALEIIQTKGNTMARPMIQTMRVRITLPIFCFVVIIGIDHTPL